MVLISNTPLRGLVVACALAGAPTYAAAVAVAPAAADAVSTSFIIINGFLVFFMQVGFLAFETGSGRAKNVRNILLKNLLDVMLAALVWWALGFGLAYGTSAKGFIGTSLFFYEGNHLLIGAVRPWFFSWTFAIAACTITSGSLAERTALLAYPAITTVIVGVLHPLVVHWLWAPGGWMGSAFRCPVLDFAGGLSVHVLGGMCGLLGAWRCGPRLGRFEPVFTAVNGGIMHADEGGQEQDRARAVAGANSASAAAIWSADPAREVELGAAHQPAEAAPRGHSLLSVTLRSKLTSCSRRHARVSCTAWLSAPHVASAGPLAGHDMALVTLGTFMLFFGWYGFNTGSVYMYLTAQPDGTAVATADLVQRTSMNTALGGAAGGLVALLFVAVCSGTYDLRVCCNGLLSGLVTVTCICGFVDPWAAVVCGSLAGCLYPVTSAVLAAAGVDDPLDACAVHLGNGVLGILLVAIVAKPAHVAALTGSSCGGVLYSSDGWLQLGVQAMAVCIVSAFAGAAAFVLFSLLHRFGLLRVNQLAELAGIDNVDHGGPAYQTELSGSPSSGRAGLHSTAGRRVQ